VPPRTLTAIRSPLVRAMGHYRTYRKAFAKNVRPW
jgi:hypothetical protein